MKKLLSILAAVSLTATVISSVTACNNLNENELKINKIINKLNEYDEKVNALFKKVMKEPGLNWIFKGDDLNELDIKILEMGIDLGEKLENKMIKNMSKDQINLIEYKFEIFEEGINKILKKYN